MMLNLFRKPQHKSIFFLGIGLAIAGAVVAISIAHSLRSRVESPQLDSYASAAKLASSQEIAAVIEANVNLAGDFTAEQIAKDLLASELVSGGTTWIVYRFNFPQTCGQAGCLHVAVDRRTKVSIPLQLFDLPDRTIPFTSVAKAACFSVKQPSHGSIEDYEICQPN